MLKGKWALVTRAQRRARPCGRRKPGGRGRRPCRWHDLTEPARGSYVLESRFGVDAVRHNCRPVAADRYRRHDGRLGALRRDRHPREQRRGPAFRAAENFSPERWDEALAVNLSAPFHLTRLALPAMKRRGCGRIVNMGSIYSTRAAAGRIDYVTTKTAIVGMTRAVAIETTRSGITCNALAGARCRRRPPGGDRHIAAAKMGAPSTR